MAEEMTRAVRLDALAYLLELAAEGAGSKFAEETVRELREHPDSATKDAVLVVVARGLGVEL